MNIQDDAVHIVIAFFTSWTSVSSLITCVQLNLAMIAVHFNYAKRPLAIPRLLFLARRSDRRIGHRN